MYDGERRLAAAVMEAAVTDFRGWPTAADASPEDRAAARRRREGLPKGLSARLEAVRRQIRAGEFLMERTDGITVFWFRAAGVNMDSARERKAEWTARLSGLRRIERAITLKVERVSKLAQRKRDLTLRKQQEDERAARRAVHYATETAGGYGSILGDGGARVVGAGRLARRPDETEED